MVTVHVFSEPSVGSDPPPPTSSQPTLPIDLTSTPETYQTQVTPPGSPLPHPTTPKPQTRVNYYGCLSPGPPEHQPRLSKAPREQSFRIHRGIPMNPSWRYLPEVANWIDQCFHCGQFGHRQALCPDRKGARAAEHFDDWRLVRFGPCGPKKLYSVRALWPSVIAIEGPVIETLEADNEASDAMMLDVHISTSSIDKPPAIPWSTRPIPLESALAELFVDAGCACPCHD
ncbi:uncharacterized protein MELLADRAFT_96267 [Melampsora larici-populina 98AG31]|uniref:CCHC-type domain-containing protein n=1 Tax=Melampsora larici-populina (strain 98AG31 / pathotype 3-4-7) TaxID=747676 RepID=F4RE57_MELLP|nr:uncharacterized protein MELLADRAFT_96267 [Melampsora larici-populina 98AG31]EGG09329.1 hypothetical protein MELLADRAFT_96267 [Melampsora larici-populina 98AG31]